MVGYPAGGDVIRIGYPSLKGGYRRRIILRAGYPPPTIGYPVGGVAYGLDTPPPTAGRVSGGFPYGLSIYRQL